MRIALTAAAVIAAVAAFASLALPWTSARLYRQRRGPAGPRSGRRRSSRLDTARDLNPLSARPDLVAGTIAIRSDDDGAAAAAFARAAEREPTNWYARLELGALDLAAGDTSRGVAQLQRAREPEPGRAPDRDGAPPRAGGRIR